MAAGKIYPRRALGDGIVVNRDCELRYLTIKGHATANTSVNLRDGGHDGPIVWSALVQSLTTQHFVFPDAPQFALGLYVEADNWGEVSLGFA